MKKTQEEAFVLKKRVQKVIIQTNMTLNMVRERARLKTRNLELGITTPQGKHAALPTYHAS